MFGGLGIWELLLILVIVLVIFGAPGKLPNRWATWANGHQERQGGVKEEEVAGSPERDKIENRENKG